MTQKKWLWSAIVTSWLMLIFMISDKYISSTWFRINVVIMGCVAFYYWVRYFKAYIDDKIASAMSRLKEKDV